MKLYAFFYRLRVPKTYLGKIMLVAFLGIHFPLLALLAILVLFSPISFDIALTILVSVLIATVLGTAMTLYVLYALLAPVSLASRALRQYLDHQEEPNLPTNFGDQAGRLLADVQYTLERLDEYIYSLRELSMKDPLTGVYNRRACEEKLAEDIAKVRRSGGMLTLAIVDADDLKPVNDRKGHAAGDACLMHITNTIGQNIRQSDWLARWGGDEFMVVLWDAEDSFLAQRVLERINEDLAEKPVRLPQGDQENITFSAGVARYAGGEGHDPEKIIEELLSRADGALYRAKRAGRNRIVYGGNGEYPESG
ncbi:MAG: GGDEF domain-containing protein [Rubrobacteraceae bacterium]